MGWIGRRVSDDGLRSVLMRQAGKGHELVKSDSRDLRKTFDLASFLYGVSFGLLLALALAW